MYPFIFASDGHEVPDGHHVDSHHGSVVKEPPTVIEILDFKSNLVNWLIMIAVFVYLWNKFVPGVLAKRAKRIEDELRNARLEREKAGAYLEEQTSRIANAEQESRQILDEAREVAGQMKKELAEQTKKDIENLNKKFDAAIASERQVAITELRTASVKAAMQLSETFLKGNVSESDRKQLLSQFMQQLDSINTEDQSLTPERVDSSPVH